MWTMRATRDDAGASLYSSYSSSTAAKASGAGARSAMAKSATRDRDNLERIFMAASFTYYFLQSFYQVYPASGHTAS
jgi:hypothetical protein